MFTAEQLNAVISDVFANGDRPQIILASHAAVAGVKWTTRGANWRRVKREIRKGGLRDRREGWMTPNPFSRTASR
jgi:hypothetical protein